MTEPNSIYEVIEKEGYSGLTIGGHVQPVGFQFTTRQWPYDDYALEMALLDGRIKQIKSGVSKKGGNKK